MNESRNALGEPLQPCSMEPVTGFYRDGCCNTGPEDMGSHTVCVVMTARFLEFSRAVGNDLSTPAPQYGFAGLKPGARWCLCAPRWKEAFDAGAAPKVVLESTHEEALEYAELSELRSCAFDPLADDAPPPPPSPTNGARGPHTNGHNNGHNNGHSTNGHGH